MVDSSAMSETPALIALAESAADAAGIPRKLFLGLVKQESDWNPWAVSGAGAIGLTQIMPVWTRPDYAASIGMQGLTVEALKDPGTNLTAGARILAAELSRFGIPELALMAYNAGAPVVLRAIAKAGSKEPQEVSDQLPSAETRAYWKSIINWAQVYAQRLDATLATIENATTEVVENAKEAGAVTPILLVGLAIIGAWMWGQR